MRVTAVLAEHGLEIDDVRWYLATILADRLLEHRTRTQELVRLIWSGKLEAELYNAEERYLEELQRKADSGMLDEHVMLEIVRDMSSAKRKRRE